MVNVDRTRDLQIFSLTLSQLRCPRKVVRSDLGIKVVYIDFVPSLNVKEVEINSEYHTPRKYRFMVSFLLARGYELLFYTFRGVWVWV